MSIVCFSYFSRPELQDLFHLDDTSISFTQQKLSSLHLGKHRANVRLDGQIQDGCLFRTFYTNLHENLLETRQSVSKIASENRKLTNFLAFSSLSVEYSHLSNGLTPDLVACVGGVIRQCFTYDYGCYTG